MPFCSLRRKSGRKLVKAKISVAAGGAGAEAALPLSGAEEADLEEERETAEEKEGLLPSTGNEAIDQLLDVATDLIPVVGSAKSLAQAETNNEVLLALGELALDAVTLGAGSAAKATAATVFKRSAKVSKGRRKIQQLAKVMAKATGAKKANRLTVVARAVEKASRDVVKSFLRLRAGFRPLHRSPQALAQAKKVNRGLRSSHARKKTLSKIFEVQRHLQKELRKKGIAFSRSTPNNADVWKKVGQAMDLRDQLGYMKAGERIGDIVKEGQPSSGFSKTDRKSVV